MASQKIGTPVPDFRLDRVTGVQTIHNDSKRLDSGACPGPDPGSAGMTEKGLLGFFANPSNSGL
jgi:hypothetical protein